MFKLVKSTDYIYLRDGSWKYWVIEAHSQILNIRAILEQDQEAFAVHMVHGLNSTDQPRKDGER